MAQTASHVYPQRMRSCLGVRGLLCLVLAWLVGAWSMVTMESRPDVEHGMGLMVVHAMEPSQQSNQPNARTSSGKGEQGVAHAAHAPSNSVACCTAGGMLSCFMGLPAMELVLLARGSALPRACGDAWFESVMHRPPLRPPQILLVA